MLPVNVYVTLSRVVMGAGDGHAVILPSGLMETISCAKTNLMPNPNVNKPRRSRMSNNPENVFLKLLSPAIAQ